MIIIIIIISYSLLYSATIRETLRNVRAPRNSPPARDALVSRPSHAPLVARVLPVVHLTCFCFQTASTVRDSHFPVHRTQLRFPKKKLLIL